MILQTLDDDLNLQLNEIYIIDELIKMIELFKDDNNSIIYINQIKYYLRENGFIIQKYANCNDSFKLTNELIYNFEIIYNLISNYKEFQKDDYYYDFLRYIYFIEIKKTSDINYRNYILRKILQENEIIKNANDIFEILLNLKGIKLYEDIYNIFNDNNIIITTIEENLNNNRVLEGTILYLFENNFLIYYDKVLKDQKEGENLEEKSIKILKFLKI